MPLPQEFLDQFAAFEQGDAVPAEPRNAATVVLVREGPPGTDAPEIYLMRRQKSMAFAGGMWVFPGGGVDPADSDAGVAWAGPSAAEWAGRLGVDEGLARALVCAAVRETFEESGVLLAGPDADSVVADTTGDDWEADRVALESRELHFTEFLRKRGLVIRTDLLGVVSGWLTPRMEPRRFRTWFFAAVLPEGQVTRDISSEASKVEWLSPVKALEEAESGRVMMLPPTYLTCLDVSRWSSPAELVGALAGRSVEMFEPRLVDSPDGPRLSDHPDYVELLEERWS